jgi:hypothetical protein
MVIFIISDIVDILDIFLNLLIENLLFKYDNYITNSLIITKYINKAYQHKNKCLPLNARIQKGR